MTKERDPLLELAMEAYSTAQQTRDASDIAVAELLDAAWLARRRRKSSPELQALHRAASSFLATRGDDERWAFASLPPENRRRADAVRQLEALARDGKALILRSSSDCSNVVAAVLCDNVVRTGLAADRRDRSDALAEKLRGLKRSTAPHAIVCWALRACGVSKTDASNWTRATSRTTR